MEKRVEVAASVLFSLTSVLNENDSSDDSFNSLSDSLLRFKPMEKLSFEINAARRETKNCVRARYY